MKDLLRQYYSRRVIGIGFFGIPYGMMFFLVLTTPQIWLKDLGISNTRIGFFALVSLPYVVKFLWAPLVDMYAIPFLSKRLGHRRSWLVFIHVSLIIGLILMGFSRPANNLFYAGFIAFTLAIFAATQDIIVDSYRIEILSYKESVPGVSILTFGYRIGSIIAKAGTLYLAAYFSWTVAYIVMACFIFIGIISTLLNPEPINFRMRKKRKKRLFLPLKELQKRSPVWPYLIVFVILYRFSDAMLNNMAMPFYMEVGFSKTEIATVINIFGIFASILGGFLGGLVNQMMTPLRALFYCGLLHMFANFMFIYIAHEGHNISLLYYAVGLENSTGGMSTTSLLVYFSRLCHKRYVSTQFALLTSFWSLATPIASVSGLLIDSLEGDWITFFVITILLSLPGLILLWPLQKFPLGKRPRLDI